MAIWFVKLKLLNKQNILGFEQYSAWKPLPAYLVVYSMLCMVLSELQFYYLDNNL